MKKILMLLLIGISAHSAIFAQCDKSFKITASKTDYIDSTGKLEREKVENSSIEINGQDITINPGEENDQLTGKIKTVSCDWKVPYKEGKMIVKSSLKDKRNEERPVTIIFEGKDAQLTVLVIIDQMPNRRIRLTMESFEEKKN